VSCDECIRIGATRFGATRLIEVFCVKCNCNTGNLALPFVVLPEEYANGAT
jgi:hypothetical protein